MRVNNSYYIVNWIQVLYEIVTGLPPYSYSKKVDLVIVN